jgi:hypothetical protein
MGYSTLYAAEETRYNTVMDIRKRQVIRILINNPYAVKLDFYSLLKTTLISRIM